jgi:formylglycine-generating enzyme required for sulfatase activity
MERAASATQVLVLDCCFSGAFAKGYIGKDDSSVDIAAQLGGKGRAIFTSSGALEYSFHKEGANLSVYTHFWVEGVETGAADRDKDGLISVDELHTYVAQKVKQAAPGMTPQFFSEEKGQKIFLARSPVRSEPENLALKYRKEVEKWVKQGAFNVERDRFSVTARNLLEEQRRKLQLSVDEAEAIASEVLQPLHEYERKKAKYRQNLIDTVEEDGYPFDPVIENGVKEYQRLLGLKDVDAEAIARQVLSAIAPSMPPMPAMPLVSPAVPVTRTESPTVPYPVVVTQQPKKVTNSPFTIHLGSLNKFQTFLAGLLGTQQSEDVLLEMIAIPGGSFWMGSPDSEGHEREQPRHQVTIAPFWMSKYPITQAQYEAVMGGKSPSYFKGYRRPVERVSWHDAIAFCEKLRGVDNHDFRLPSEAEWEYACRAGTETFFYFGETISTATVNYNMYYRGTTDVEKFPANDFGLYDMHGNVWEWCADHWHENYQGAPIDGSIWKTCNDKDLRLSRGGSWANNFGSCRSSVRRCDSPNRVNELIGFRVVCSAPRTL